MLSDVRFTGHDFLQIVSYFEALESIIREKKGPFSMMTLHDLEEGVKFDTCKRFADHDFQEVVSSY